MHPDADVQNFCDSLALARAHARCRELLAKENLSWRDREMLTELLSKESLLEYELCRGAWAEVAAHLSGPTFKSL